MKLPPEQVAAIAQAAGAKSLVVAIPPGVLPPAEPAPKGKAKKKRELPADCILQRQLGRWEVTILDWHPTSLNELTKRGNHYTASTRKRRDAITLGRALRAAGVPAATGKRRVGLVIVLGPRQRGCDGDAYWKSLLDGLQRVKALTGDNRQRCETVPVVYERGAEKASRLILDDMQAKSASKPPETRDLIRCLESFYAADRIESCRSLATVLMVEERGYSDAMLGAGRWVLEIPRWRPATLNELTKRGNHWSAARLKKRDREMVAGYAAKLGLPPATTKRRVTMLQVRAGKQRPIDDDNAWKSVLDALVQCRLLVDDKPEWLERMPLEQEKGPRKLTRITLEDLP